MSCLSSAARRASISLTSSGALVMSPCGSPPRCEIYTSMARVTTATTRSGNSAPLCSRGQSEAPCDRYELPRSAQLNVAILPNIDRTRYPPSVPLPENEEERSYRRQAPTRRFMTLPICRKRTNSPRRAPYRGRIARRRV